MDNIGYIENGLWRPISAFVNVIDDVAVNNTTYMGIRMQKFPCDLWMYQEIIYEYMPNVIIEIGNKWGGTALFLANTMLLSGSAGRVIGVDIDHGLLDNKVRRNFYCTFIEGDALAKVNEVAKHIRPEDRVMVIEDSSHTYENTLAVMELYSVFIKPGGWLIVEDSIINNGLNKVNLLHLNPMRAIEDFLKCHDDFESDRSKEKFFLTWNPKGFIQRKGFVK